MRAAIVHFSDIHLRKSGSPIVEWVDQLVNAVSSAEADVSFYLIVLSGDIANTGQGTEYQAALRFFREFEGKLRTLHPDADIQFVSVPGNHDCVLPKSRSKLRSTLVQGLVPSIQDLKQDEELLREVVKAQAPYNRFRKQLRKSTWNGICETMMFDHRGHRIQVNLYNTALLSQNPEEQGQLHVPVQFFEEQISLVNPVGLSISVFHHSYVWLESNVAVSSLTCPPEISPLKM